MKNFKRLTKETEARIIADREKRGVFQRRQRALRRNPDMDAPSVMRPDYVRDVEKIINSPYYNRYCDKTQVLSFYKDDDLTRRALHVQLVSRIARTIGAVLNLDADLIEAIALGHDVGHTPFGHAGERFLSGLLQNETGRFFNHNVHSVRVLDGIFENNLTLDVLSGILCHNGELPLDSYRPSGLKSFEAFDGAVERAYIDEKSIKDLVPNTLEGCLVRICDIIAYLGKDRQDFERAKLGRETDFQPSSIGLKNSEIINNLCVDIIENSYGKDCLSMDGEVFAALKKMKDDNYAVIYKNPKVTAKYDAVVKPMMEKIFKRILDDLTANHTLSPVFQHHIEFVNAKRRFFDKEGLYLKHTTFPQIAADYIASMSDNYFLELYRHLFGEALSVEFKNYF